MADTRDMRWRRVPLVLLIVLVSASLLSSSPAARAVDVRHLHDEALGRRLKSPSPSGLAMPTAAAPGWRCVFADDFTGSRLNTSKWFAYNDGQPGGDPGAWFAASHLSVRNGMLVISAYRDPKHGDKWTTDGIQVCPSHAQRYGKYLVRMKCQAANGVSDVCLLWPADHSWPPEIDFAEDNGGQKRRNYASLHFGPAASFSSKCRHTPVDLTRWHTVGVEWTPGTLVYTIDGRSWATVRSSHVPSIPMVLCVQSQAWRRGVSTWETPIDSTTPKCVHLYVDWVVAYARSASAVR